eukprot:9596371-Alexandrium_andersonii.AAC.1
MWLCARSCERAVVLYCSGSCQPRAALNHQRQTTKTPRAPLYAVSGVLRRNKTVLEGIDKRRKALNST